MNAYLRQGQLKFVPGYRLQTRWGLSEAVVFSLECAGAPLVALAAYGGGGPLAVLVGVAMMATAILLLLRHLGRPARAWRTLSSLRHSWISRGSLALGSVLMLGLAYLLAWRIGGQAPTGAGAGVLVVLLAVLGLFVAAYPGLVLASLPGIGFWNSALLPVLSLLQGGSTALLLLAVFGTALPGSAVGLLATAALGMLVALALALALYLASMLRRGGGAAESARYLMQGHRGQFAGGACVLGIGLPLALTAWVALAPATGAAAAALCGVAAAARLAGDVALRHAFLKVGMYDPVI